MSKDTKSVYYTNGINEKRIIKGDVPPKGWHKGRVTSTVTTLGSFFVTNGENEMLLKANSEIPEGYRRGRSRKVIETMISSRKEKKYIWYNNGIKNTKIDINDAVPDGFVKGRLPMSDNQKQKLSIAHKGIHQSKETLEKIINTKKKNNSFNSSIIEDSMYNDLINLYGKSSVKRNYKCDKYPFYCDFYIVEEDLFIELNAHWTHGGKPFDPDDEYCKSTLLEWQEKAKTSQFYRNAIHTWTVRDVEKQKWAKEHNLNYKIIY